MRRGGSERSVPPNVAHFPSAKTLMNRRISNERSDCRDAGPPSDGWLFAQKILETPAPRITSPEAAARSHREKLKQLARFSSRHADELRRLEAADAVARRERESLEWAARISTEAEVKLRALQRAEAQEREAWQRVDQFYDEAWDASRHPRASKGQPDGGQWIANGGGSSGRSAAAQSSMPHASDTLQDQPGAQLTSYSGASSPHWPTTGPTSTSLPKVGSGVGAGASAAAGIGAGAFLHGLRNASMGAYWARLPGVQAMPKVWVYELEKRVRAGTLSRDDAVQIFNTAVLGSEAQGFQPSGSRMSEVHKSATDFLDRAEAVYFARKKKRQKELGWATQKGGYQLSDGRVFPTKHNSGLEGHALRQEQERFFERGLLAGKDPGELRGQAREAGIPRTRDERLDDSEVEAAMQRAIEKAKRRNEN